MKAARPVLSVLVLLGLTLTGCPSPQKPTSAWPLDPKNVVATVEGFQRLAGEDAPGAFSRHMAPEAVRPFRSVTKLGWVQSHPGGVPPALFARIWGSFFHTSIYAVSYTGPHNVLVAFCNPWSDVLAVTMWEEKDGVVRITDADVVPADFFHNRGRPPFDLIPEWRKSKEPPMLSVPEATYKAVRAFQGAFAGLRPLEKDRAARMGEAEIEASRKRSANWRSEVPALQNPQTRDACHFAAGMRIQRNFTAIDAFCKGDKFRDLREQTLQLLKKLHAGGLGDVLRTATGTIPEARAALERDMTGKWNQVSVVSFCATKNFRFVLMQTAETANAFLCFMYRQKPKTQQWYLWRIDLVNHQAYYTYKQKHGEI